MLQEDSNGETTFEIIDKKAEELSGVVEKTGWFLFLNLKMNKDS